MSDRRDPPPPHLGVLEPGHSPVKRGWALAAASVGSVLALLLALGLGSWAFDYRRYQQHEGRLRRLVEKAPTLDRVERGLEDEGSHLVASPAAPAALAEVARDRAGAKAAEVLEKGRRWPVTRVFEAGDMVYFLFFDGDGVLRDFTCASR